MNKQNRFFRSTTKNTLIFIGLNIIPIIVLCLFLSSKGHASTCNLTMLKKKITSKTRYLTTGETVSKSMYTKLVSVCNINTKLMSSKEVRDLKFARLNKQLNKLGVK